MLKCKVCRKWFKLKTEDRYDIVKSQTAIGALMEAPVVYEAFDCPKCGKTLHEICSKLYSEWNIKGHRFYITWQAIDKYPLNKQKQEIYDAVRKFVIESMPKLVLNHFAKVIDQVRLKTLVLMYQKNGFL